MKAIHIFMSKNGNTPNDTIHLSGRIKLGLQLNITQPIVSGLILHLCIIKRHKGSNYV